MDGQVISAPSDGTLPAPSPSSRIVVQSSRHEVASRKWSAYTILDLDYQHNRKEDGKTEQKYIYTYNGRQLFTIHICEKQFGNLFIQVLILMY